MVNDIVYDHWLQLIEAEETCCMATILQENVSGNYRPLRLCMTEDGEMKTTIQRERIVEAIQSIMKEKLASSFATSETISLSIPGEETVQVFIDVFIPKPKVMIFGAGHDAIPVAKYSISLGYPTTVIDAREMYNNDVNFPSCDRLMIRPEAFGEHITITEHTYIIVMNHHIEKDRETLRFVLPSPSPYVGVLGPRSRREKMLQYLQDDGVFFTETTLEKMYNPIGLDIGAETPEEIAMSMMTEIIAIQKGHHGGFLHDKDKIHRYSSKYNEVVDES